MSASTRYKLPFALLAATFAIAQDRSDPVPPSHDTGAKVISRVEPKLPDVPLRGPVLVLVTVDKTGLPAKIRIVNSSDHLVDRAIISAIQKWRYQPATKNGIPVETMVAVSIPAGEHQQ